MITKKLESTIIFILLAAGLVFLFGLILFLWIRKKSTAEDDSTEDDVEGVRLEDATEMVPFDDVCDDMIVDDGGKRFTAVLMCPGVEFYAMSMDEQVSIQNGFVAFLHSQRMNFTIRQAPENINLDNSLIRYEKALEKNQNILMQISALIEKTNAQKQEIVASGNVPDPAMDQWIRFYKNQFDAYRFRIRHMEDEMAFMKSKTVPGIHNEKPTVTIAYSWYASETDGSSVEQTYEKAKSELEKAGRTMINALMNAGVRARRADTVEILDLFRKQFAPYSANIYNVRDIFNDSSWNDDVVRTDSLEKTRNEYRREVAERMIYGGVK